MPIYEYQCANCNHHFDLMQKISDELAKHCPKCNKDTLIKLVSAAGFQLKGTGWYATDFKNKCSASTDTSNTKEDTTPKTDTSKASDTPAAPTNTSKGEH